MKKRKKKKLSLKLLCITAQCTVVSAVASKVAPTIPTRCSMVLHNRLPGSVRLLKFGSPNTPPLPNLWKTTIHEYIYGTLVHPSHAHRSCKFVAPVWQIREAPGFVWMTTSSGRGAQTALCWSGKTVKTKFTFQFYTARQGHGLLYSNWKGCVRRLYKERINHHKYP